MFKKYYEYANQINKNSKTAKKMKKSLVGLIIVLCIVIFFCMAVPYIINQAYFRDDAANTIKIEASDGDSACFDTETAQSMTDDKKVKGVVKYSDIMVEGTYCSDGGAFLPYGTSRLTMRVLYENNTVSHKSPVVKGRDAVNKDEVVVSKQFAQDSGLDEDLIGKYLSLKVFSSGMGMLNTYIDDDTDPNNESINSKENFDEYGYNDYLQKPLDIYIFKELKVVGIVGEVAPKGLSIFDSLKLKIPREEAEIWINADNLNTNSYDVPIAKRHDIVTDKIGRVNTCVLLTYNYLDFNARSKEVVDSGLVYVPNNPYACYLSLFDNITLGLKAQQHNTKPVYTYLITYKRFNRAVKIADFATQTFVSRYEEQYNTTISHDSRYTKIQEIVQMEKMTSLKTVKEYADLLFIFIAIFGSVMLMVLTISQLNAIRFYIANKKRIL